MIAGEGKILTAGGFDSHMLDHTSRDNKKLWHELMAQLGCADARQEAAKQRAECLATGLKMPYANFIYQKIFEAVEDQVTPKCPFCHVKFDSFVACCSITCACGRRFCAMCLTGKDEWVTEADTHPHILECGHGVPGFDGLYISIDMWQAHMQRRRAAWLDANMQANWPKAVKDRLRVHFG